MFKLILCGMASFVRLKAEFTMIEEVSIKIQMRDGRKTWNSK